MEYEVDVLESSLQSLYGFTPIVHSSGGSLWEYAGPKKDEIKAHCNGISEATAITLRIPDTSAKNWGLHASSIWVASIFIADQICSDTNWLNETIATNHTTARSKLRVLEIGAGAGLPSILIAKRHPERLGQVVISDYPDDGIMSALRENVEMNFTEADSASKDILTVAPFDWLDASPTSFDIGDGFDLIIGTDVLWNSELHAPMLESITRCLKKDESAKILLVAGLHTGRYTIQRFLENVSGSEELALDTVMEKEATGAAVREWDAQREDGESEEERRRWVVEIRLRVRQRTTQVTSTL